MDIAAILDTLPAPTDDAPADEGGENDAPVSEVVETQDATEEAAAEEPEDPFSDAALATKDGVAKARDAVRSLQKKANSKHVELSRRENRLKQERQAFNAERVNQSALYRRVNAELDTIRNGSADDVIGALGRLSGKSGAEVYKEITDSVIANGKKPAPSRELIELRERVEQLTGALKEKFQTDEQRATEARVSAAEQRVIERFTATNQESGEPMYPALAHFAEGGRQSEILQYMINIRTEAAQAGEPIDIATALGQIEAELRPMVPQGSRSAAAKADAGRATGATSRNPRIPAKRPLGSSVSTSRSNVRASTRDMTEEERLDELARDPDILASLGIG